MAINAAEIVWYKPLLQSDNTPAQNGGRMSSVQDAGTKNSTYPDVSEAQRAAGVAFWRKRFVKVENLSNTALLSPRLFIESGTPGNGYVLLYPGTQTDTQNQVVARPYAAGTLSAGVLAGATVLDVDLEHADVVTANPFRVGDSVRISSKTDVDDALGTTEIRTLTGVSYAGTVATLTLSAGTGQAWSAGAKVASCWLPGDTQARHDGVATTGGAVYNSPGTNLTVDAIGGVEQSWTVVITNAATGAFRLDGDTLGAGVAVGTIGADFSPINPDQGRPYFTLRSSGWGSAGSNGATVTFTTHPHAIPYWERHTVPAGAAAIASDSRVVAVEGESA